MSSPEYLKLLQDAWDLHERKNAGYAGEGNTDPWANFRMSEEFGVSALDGCLVRMSDKYIRVTNLRKNPANDQVNESVRDTLQDLAAYALIAICLLDEEKVIARQTSDNSWEMGDPLAPANMQVEFGWPDHADMSVDERHAMTMDEFMEKMREPAFGGPKCDHGLPIREGLTCFWCAVGAR